MLYHYTFAENIPSIIATGLKPSIRIVGDDSSDAQWGDGQYLTDLTPTEAATVTRYQFSAAIFRIPWKFGRPPNLKDVGWIQVNAQGLAVRRVSPLLTDRFPHRSIYLVPNTTALPLANRVSAQGLVTFQPSDSGYR